MTKLEKEIMIEIAINKRITAADLREEGFPLGFGYTLSRLRKNTSENWRRAMADMTTRDELAALADDIELCRRGHSKDSEMFGYILHHSEQLPVIAALRLASRQEVSVEELARELRGCDSNNDGLYEEQACALLAKYSITNRS